MPNLLSNCITTQDFIIAYEEQEAIEITNLTNEFSNAIDLIKLQHAIDRAHEFVNARYLMASDCGRAYIKISCRQILLWLTRAFLDTTKSRPFVVEDEQRAIDLLNYACNECTTKCPLNDLEIIEILGPDYITTKPRIMCSSGHTERNRFNNRIKNRKVLFNSSHY